MLLPRVLTALVGIPVLIFLIHWGGLPYDLLVVAVAAISIYEYGLILQLGGRQIQRATAMAGGAAMALCLVLDGPLSLILAACLAAMMLQEMASPVPSLDRLALSVFGVVFLGWMLAHLALLRHLKPNGERLTFLFFICVWIMDTTSYAVGKTMGRRSLAPYLSPKKTWEGAAAGFIAAVAFVMSYWNFFLRLNLSVLQALGLGVIIATSGQLSDLAESLIKRAVGAKDSGGLLPGHGGVMDRFDSFFLSAPIVYYYLALL